MTDQFSSQISQWLSRYHAFVGTGRIYFDPLSGRSLGPASGTLWENFPFLAPCTFTGIFAGLSVSGFDPSIKSVRLLDYRSRHGFRPVADGPFVGIGWRNVTGDDWSKLDPTAFTPLANIPTPVHQADLRFALDETEYSTSDPEWSYRQRELSKRHLLHCWSHPDGLLVTAVCFTSYSETNRPFLRPCYATDPGAAIDPACLFPHRRMAGLFGGLTVLTAGEEITLNVAEQTNSIGDRDSLTSGSGEKETGSPDTTVITVTKNPSPGSMVVRTLSGARPGSGENISFASIGTNKITRQYSEIDTDTGYVNLVPHTLYLLSRDVPCCRCEDYVADYERVRELFVEHEELIDRYNELFEKMSECREKLKAKLLDRAKPVRVRIDKTESGDRETRCEFTLIYTNIRQEEHEHKNLVIKLTSTNGPHFIRSAKVIQRPRDAEFKIVSVSETTIKISSFRSPPMSHTAARLQVTIMGPIPADIALDVPAHGGG